MYINISKKPVNFHDAFYKIKFIDEAYLPVSEKKKKK